MMLVLFYIFLILCGFLAKRSKLITFLSFCLLFILIGFNYSNPDYENYEIWYEKYSFKTIQSFILFTPGYDYLCILFNKIGFSYSQFRALISFVSCVLLYITVNRFSVNKAFVSSVYLLFFIVLDVVQIRNFFSLSFICLGVSELLTNKKLNYVCFIICCLIAISIHPANIFFVLILLIKNRPKIVVLFFSVAIIFFIKSLIFVFINDSLGVSDVNSYLFNTSIRAALFYSILQLLNAIYIEKSNTSKEGLLQDSSKSGNLSINISRTLFNNFIVNANWLLLLMIPFYFDNLIFMRIFRNLAFLNIIFLTNKSKNTGAQFNALFLLLYCFFFLYFFILTVSDPLALYKSVFYNNYLSFML